MEDEDIQKMLQEAAQTATTAKSGKTPQQAVVELTPEMEQFMDVNREGMNQTKVEQSAQNIAAKTGTTLKSAEGSLEGLSDRMQSTKEILNTVNPENRTLAMGNPADGAATPEDMMAGALTMDFSNDFEGAKVDGITPKGTPEPEELSGFGEALSQFGEMITKPGAQKFLGQMAQAFTGGRPNAAGTILGKAGVQSAEARMEQALLKGLNEGKTISEIDAGGQPSSETMNRALASHQTEQKMQQEDRQLDQRDRRLDQTDEQMEIAANEQEFNEWMGKSRIAQAWERIGLQKDQLSLQRAQAISEAAKEQRPADVESWQHGVATEAVAQQYLDVAKQFRKQQLGDMATVAKVNEAFENEKTGFDPQAVFNHLPAELRAKALAEATQLSKTMANSATGGQEVDPAALEESVLGIGNIPTVTDPSELEEGQIFKGPDGNFYKRQKNGNKRLGG